MGKTYVAEAPRFIERLIQEEINKSKAELKELKIDKWCKPNFFIMYGNANLEDDTKQTYYNLWLYKSLWWFTIRWEEDLKEVLKFLNGKSKLKWLTIQMLDVDKVDYSESN